VGARKWGGVESEGLKLERGLGRGAQWRVVRKRERVW
jgi:hypothetical protein